MLLAVDNLKVDYQTPAGAVRAVERGTFDVPAGEIVGLVGESGCGKTTLARAVTGVMARSARVSGGSIRFEGEEIAGAPPSKMRDLLWKRMAFVPQSAMNALDPVYRVGQQIGEVLVYRGGYRKADVAPRIAELFEMVGLNPSRQHDYPHQFSGGMRQRVGIALALALDPALLIADEPVTALDVIVQRQVLDTLKSLQRRLNLSVILVTHDISVVAYVCDRVVVMYAGQVIESGKAVDVLERPQHPYTMGLTNAFPDLGRAASTLVPIAGAPPDLRDPPKGCRFAPRCPFVEPRCRETSPALETDAPGHAAACLRVADAPMLREQARDPARWAA
ncbi:ABC transporter ATP-binding protein [Terrarubrum flagellatum]|uniref:ABC transporter ATP-binding protein n=1 Tax=Terrirubrum flagellatum TaxID=2895980 RepID=UPI003144D68B